MNITDEIESHDRHQTIATLRRLIEACHDVQAMYAAASEDAVDPQMKELFRWHSRQRTQFARDLQGLVAGCGAAPENGGTVMGSLQRGFMEIRAALGASSELVALTECERAEDRVIKIYQAALRQQLPWDIQSTIRHQFDILKVAHEHIRQLRDLRS